MLRSRVAIATVTTPASERGTGGFLADPGGRIHTPCAPEAWSKWHARWFDALLQLPPAMMERAFEVAPVAYSSHRLLAVLGAPPPSAGATVDEQHERGPSADTPERPWSAAEHGSRSATRSTWSRSTRAARRWCC